MKNLSKLFKGLLIVFISVSMIACSDDDDNGTPMVSNTIADFVVANQTNYSILLAALQIADGELVTVLSGAGPYTVFAPDDAAFNAFLAANNFASINDVPTDVLSQILLNHVVSGSVQSSALTTGYIQSESTATPNSEKMSMFVNTDGGVNLNGVSNVTGADNLVDNGVVHLVDAVIGLPTVVTFAVADPTFDILELALTREASFTFVQTLSTADGTDPAPFTVFAPTNTAFGELLTELEVSALGDIATETLLATLSLHVVDGLNVVAESLTDNFTVPTLGGNITANVTGGATLTDANSRISNIVATNVQAANGIIHAIDKVILPNLSTK
jgi:uncharacterized surface protein with fasciclin (FAS1) repeats